MSETLDVATRLEHLTMAAQLSGVNAAEVVLPRDETVELHGMRFHYLDWGDPQRRAVLLLHGARLSAHTWDVVCLALSARFHCIALDARGHGDSDWAPPGGYTLDDHLSDVEGLVGTLGLRDFVLVGHSMGGGTALAHAGKHSSNLKALTIVDTGPHERGAVPRPGLQRMHDFVNGPREFDSLEEVVERAVAFNPARDRRLLRRSLLNNMRQSAAGQWSWKYDRDGLSGRTPEESEARRETLEAALPRIHCPTLLLRGGNSDIFLDEDAERVAAQLPHGSWQRIPDAGHTIQGDNPKGLLDALLPFLDRAGA